MLNKLKRVISPLVPDQLKKRKQSGPFDGVFSHFSDVVSKTDYNTQESLAELQQHMASNLAVYEQHSLLPSSDNRSQITNLLPLLIAALPQQKVTVLDYGGGLGETFLNCLELAPKAELNYHVFDLVESMEQGKSVFKKLELVRNCNIEFCETLEHVNNIDILYFGSVLQYIENYSEKVSSLLDKQPNYCFMTDHFFGSHPTYVTSQVNMPDRRMPYLIIQLEEIISLFASKGYDLIYNSTNYQPFHNFDNFPEKYRVQSSCNLLFKKI